MVSTREFLEEILDPLNAATLAIAEPSDLSELLQRLADIARQLIGSRYAAIGVPDANNELQLFIISGLDAAKAAKIPHLPKGLGLLGAILHEKRTICIPKLADDPRSSGFPGNHPPMRSFLGTPIIADNQIVGSIYLTDKLGEDDFSPLDEKLIEIFAAHAAIAIKKTRLLEQSREHERQLEILNEAALAISGELTLHQVLQQIVDSLREVIGAEYAALGVPNNKGLLEEFITSGLLPEKIQAIGHLPHGHGLLGAIIKEKRPIRLPKIGDDPRSVGFPANHPPMDSFLGVPIMAGGEMLGNLYLTNKIGADEFTAYDQTLVERLAAHAAVAIQTARLYEEVGRLAVVEERTRIGMDLHDGVIQSIYAVGLTLESTRLSLPEEDSTTAQLLQTTIDALNDTIRDIRNYILDLRPRRFGGDLATGLARLVREFQANTMVKVTMMLPETAVSNLPPALARTFFLTTQEALANIARHARAQHVTIELSEAKAGLLFKIRDDGVGFDPSSRTHSVGHGLSNMHTRAKSLNGSCIIDSAPGQGTTITLHLPL